MPFFFGRSVFVAIGGAGTMHGTGPFWAYCPYATVTQRTDRPIGRQPEDPHAY